jgi:group I intron endonuclease
MLNIFNLRYFTKLPLTRVYSNKTNNNLNPVKIYPNVELNKDKILKENKRAIYRLINNINNKSYIGSSINLTVRFYKYFSSKHLEKNKTTIHNALLKYGFNKFTLEILEYCEEGVNPITREQYYFKLLKPEYNILKVAGSSLGFRHSEETLEFFRNCRKVSEETRKNLSLAATGRTLTKEDILKISEARKGMKSSDETRAKLSAATTALIGVCVLVEDKYTDEVLEFASLTEAGKFIGVSRPAIGKAIGTGKLIKNRYIVEKKK